MNKEKELDLVQFRTNKKELLMKIAQDKAVSLNALINFIIDEYIKREMQDER